MFDLTNPAYLFTISSNKNFYDTIITLRRLISSHYVQILSIYTVHVTPIIYASQKIFHSSRLVTLSFLLLETNNLKVH